MFTNERFEERYRFLRYAGLATAPPAIISTICATMRRRSCP
jgi:hypothetical protein